MILALHGKPMDVATDTPEARTVLASGFRFYGILYLLVAFCLIATVPAVITAGIPTPGFWAALLLASSCYLTLVCQFAFSGARKYASEHTDANDYLLVFFIGVIAFVACFCGAAVVISHHAFPQFDWLNFALGFLMAAFALPSYLIEILFLVNHSPSNRSADFDTVAAADLCQK